MKLNGIKDLISVIVPVYNVEKYIGECLNSILAQTYSNIEVFCIDDQSSDSSGDICEQYADIDSRIHVIRKKRNGGLSEARNTGIKAARGEYITFIDSDDWVDKKYLECLYEGIKHSGADIAQCGYIQILNSTLKVQKGMQQGKSSVITGMQALESLYANSSVKASIIYTIVCNKLFKSNIVADLMFPSGRMYEDQFFTYKCFERAQKVYTTDEKLYNYRINLNSITRQNYSMRFQDEIAAHSEQIQFFKNKNIDFMSVVIARIEPLCIWHYGMSEFEGIDKAKKNAYRYAWKYLIPYLKNNKVCLKNKFKVVLFILNPGLFIYHDLNVNFDARFAQIENKW